MTVQIDRKRKQEAADVELVTPQGSHIEVTATRAEQLLARDPIGFGDGVYRKYALAGEDNVVEFATKTSAAPPRKGDGANTVGSGA